MLPINSKTLCDKLFFLQPSFSPELSLMVAIAIFQLPPALSEKHVLFLHCFAISVSGATQLTLYGVASNEIVTHPWWVAYLFSTLWSIPPRVSGQSKFFICYPPWQYTCVPRRRHQQLKNILPKVITTGRKIALEKVCILKGYSIVFQSCFLTTILKLQRNIVQARNILQS